MKREKSNRFSPFVIVSGDIEWNSTPIDAKFNCNKLTKDMISGYHTLERKPKGRKFESVGEECYHGHIFSHDEHYRDLICLDTREPLQLKVISDDHGGPPHIQNIKLHCIKNAKAFTVGVFQRDTGILYKIYEVDTLRLMMSDKLMITAKQSNFIDEERTQPVPVNKQQREIALSEFIKIAQREYDLPSLRPDLYKDFSLLNSSRSITIQKASNKMTSKLIDRTHLLGFE